MSQVSHTIWLWRAQKAGCMVASPRQSLAHVYPRRPMPLNARSAFAGLARVAGIMGISSCYCFAPPDPDPHPPIATIDILPWRLTVIKGGTFTVRARVRDQYGNTLPDDRAAEVR